MHQLDAIRVHKQMSPGEGGTERWLEVAGRFFMRFSFCGLGSGAARGLTLMETHLIWVLELDFVKRIFQVPVQKEAFRFLSAYLGVSVCFPEKTSKKRKAPVACPPPAGVGTRLGASEPRGRHPGSARPCAVLAAVCADHLLCRGRWLIPAFGLVLFRACRCECCLVLSRVCTAGARG